MTGTFSESFVQLFICLTTANFPDIMMPYIRSTADRSRFNACFFVLFLLIGLYFLLNLLLAVVVDHYKKKTKKNLTHRLRRRKQGFQKALELLPRDRNGQIAYATLQPVLARIWPRYCCGLGTDPAILELLFKSIDMDDGKSERALTPFQFEELCELIQSTKVFRLHRVHHKGAPGAAGQAPLAGPVKQALINCAHWVLGVPHIEAFFDVCIVLSISVIFLQALLCDADYHELSGESKLNCKYRTPGTAAFNSFRSFDMTFLGIFVVEQFVKVAASGFHRYMHDGYNQVDFLATFGSVVYLLLTLIFNLDPSSANAFLILRMTRLLRVANKAAVFESITRSAATMCPILMRLFVVLYLLFYIFAIIGMELFAGKLAGNKHSLYAQAHYFDNNFDSFARAMVVIFEMFVVNNWHVLMSGGVEATGTRWARLYFIAFYIAAVIFVTNVIVAFMVDAFLMSYGADRLRKKRQKAKEEETKRMAAAEGGGAAGHRDHASMSLVSPQTCEHWEQLVAGAAAHEKDFQWEVKPNRRFSTLYKRMFAEEMPEQLSVWTELHATSSAVSKL